MELQVGAMPDPTAEKQNKKRWAALGAGMVVAITMAGATVVYVARQQTTINPFATGTKASAVTFPLYYPSKLPKGYQTDAKSVDLPQSGVVVYTIDGPDGAKLYLSQQARPSTFNFGGYYHNFSDLQEDVTSNGTIAVGYISNKQTAIGSMVVGSKTWVLVNTDAKNLPLSSLHDLLASLVISH